MDIYLLINILTTSILVLAAFFLFYRNKHPSFSIIAFSQLMEVSWLFLMSFLLSDSLEQPSEFRAPIFSHPFSFGLSLGTLFLCAIAVYWLANDLRKIQEKSLHPALILILLAALIEVFLYLFIFMIITDNYRFIYYENYRGLFDNFFSSEVSIVLDILEMGLFIIGMVKSPQIPKNNS